MPGYDEMGEEGAPPDQSPPMRPNSVDPTQVTVESPKTMNVEASASTNSLSAAQNHTWRAESTRRPQGDPHIAATKATAE